MRDAGRAAGRRIAGRRVAGERAFAAAARPVPGQAAAADAPRRDGGAPPLSNEPPHAHE
ncbi:sensor histidine kinase KdpD [Burkholderia mallei FMH]|nr:sensor histidine kinase KdpD [Burkholderia mallei FMH]